jgi:hypothetical protein
MHVETSLEYVENPKCWGGSTQVRQGYLVLLKQDEPFVYIFSQNCDLERYVEHRSVLNHFSLLEIEESSKQVEDELGIDRSLGTNSLTSRQFPSLETPVYEVKFSLEKLEAEGFPYFKLLELEVLDRSPKTFEDLFDAP